MKLCRLYTDLKDDNNNLVEVMTNLEEIII